MMWVPIHQPMAATKAEAGMVKIQAHTILPATPQRTADRRCEAPTPTMAPVMVWVVDTGTPSGWAAVIGVVVALLLGATVLMATIAFGGQRYFEYQVEEARKISQ